MRLKDKVGLYWTISFHLVVLIILLVSQIGYSLKHESSILLDFSKQEMQEREKKESDFKEDISRRIEQLLAASEAGQLNVRNVVVNRGALKDDRGTNAEELYRDAEKLSRELNEGKQNKIDDSYLADAPKEASEESKQPKESNYSGPSVVSYELGKRKASKLPIPAYRCYGAGMVTVIITVDNSGTVLSAKVHDEVSSDDQCLRNFAVRAARMSRFSSDSSAPSRHVGNIVYQFIAQ